ncbi:MAG TPA: hypothetical protein VKX24_08700 [Acidimicrobiia bacterium]|nr:hypothetical protein [Acidimicrobiia bacterium]HZQ78445.1 hypothetical protein [Acidimicrobiia bacterium]
MPDPLERLLAWDGYRRALDWEDAAALQRIGRLYRFGLPELEPRRRGARRTTPSVPVGQRPL